MDAGKAIIKELDSRQKKLEKHYSEQAEPAPGQALFCYLPNVPAVR